MKKSLIALALLGSATLASAQEWKFFPITNDPAFKLEPGIAVMVDSVDPDVSGASRGNASGVEFSFNCGLVQTADNRIRTSLKLHHSKEGRLDATAVELSPRYMLPVGNGFFVGAGPSVAVVRLKDSGVTKTLAGAGAAIGAEWRSGEWFVGADLRWHDLSRKNGVSYDHSSIGLHAGLRF